MSKSRISSDISDKVLGNLQKGLAFIISAPAGTGKNTLVDMLLKEFPKALSESISFTTRKPRENEKEGVHYHFLSKEEFQKKLDENDFLEHAKVFDHEYGTSKSYVESLQNQGKHVILVIDTQGALELKKNFPAIFIFVSPPDIQTLRERLYGRNTETEEIIEKRLSWAEEEIKKSKEYDYLIVNKDLQKAYDVLRSIIIAEEHRIHNQEEIYGKKNANQ